MLLEVDSLNWILRDCTSVGHLLYLATDQIMTYYLPWKSCTIYVNKLSTVLLAGRLINEVEKQRSSVVHRWYIGVHLNHFFEQSSYIFVNVISHCEIINS